MKKPYDPHKDYDSLLFRVPKPSFDKPKWQREYMKEYRAGKRRRPNPPKPI